MPVPVIKRIVDLRDADNITKICNEEGKPVIITRNGKTHFVIISEAQYEEYEDTKAKLELYEKLAEAEAEAETGFEGYLLEDVAQEFLEDLD